MTEDWTIGPAVCTSVSRAKLAQAVAMASLVSAHHPGTALHVLVVDDPEGLVTASSAMQPGAPAGQPPGSSSPHVEAGEPLRLVAPGEIGVAMDELHLLACCTSPDELAAVLAPRLAASLLSRGAPAVCVLAPEVVAVNPVDELSILASIHGVVLVSRLLAEVPDDGCYPDEVTLGAWGIVDPGIVGVSAGSAEFLTWWSSALRRAAARERRHSLAVAQPLLDLLVGEPDVHLLRDPAYGVAWWNAHERVLGRTPEGMYTSGERPLRMLHLAGFDPERPYLMRAEPHRAERVRLSSRPLLAQLCLDQSARLLLAAGHPVVAAGSGPPAFRHCADGSELDDRMARLVRRALAAASSPSTAAPAALPPDPFDPASVEAFFDWLMTGDETSTLTRLVPRYLLEVYAERRDLQWHFPRLGTVDMLGFRHWVGYHGITEVLPPALRPHLESCAWWAAPSGVFVAPPASLSDGVTLTGYLRAELGVGEAARLVLDALSGTSVGVSTIPVDLPSSRQAHPFHQLGVPVADRRINVIWLNAEHLLGYAALVSPAFFEGRYNVGGWAWETEHLPQEMAANAAMLDEIWVPSAFVRAAVEPLVEVPVHTFPHPVVPPVPDRAFDPVARLGVPPGFFFLFTFDFLSSFERKNPLAVIEAYARAFPGGGPGLVVKSVNGDQRPIEHERLLAVLGERPDIVAVDAYLSAGQRAALLGACGAYVSLHRSEGFGLGMAEAMSLGRPVIATAYSGNLEFMDEQTAWLVPAGRVAVGPHAPPYDPEETWADPDLDSAAEAMRAVYEDQPGAARRAERARIRVLAEHGRARAVRFLAERIEIIQRLDDQGYLSAGPEALRKLLGTG